MKRIPVLPILALLGVCAVLFLIFVLPPLRNASVAKAVRRHLVARGYGDVESSLRERHVYLWGRSKSPVERAAVEGIARNVPGVEGVSNYTGIEDDLAAAVATSESLRTELGATLARLEETGQRLDAMRQRAESTEAALVETRTALANRTEELAAFKAAWSRDKAQLEMALDAQKSANTRLQQTLASSEILLAEARRVIAARDLEYAREAGALRKSLADVGAKLAATESGLAESEQARKAEVERVVMIKAELDAATAEMAAMEAKRADTEKLLTETRRVLAVRDQEFTAQSEKLAAAESALEALRQELEQKAEETPSPQQQANPPRFLQSF